MTQINRIPGGLIDYSKTITFQFDGNIFSGHPGDTLASALLANNQKLVGRSFKYHRPRGIFSAGSEEPNALVAFGNNESKTPNTRATNIELFDGLVAESQNYRGSLKSDFMAIADLFSAFMPAGFYYKTFMWPKSFWEKIYEPAIRASAGLGKLPLTPDIDIYGKGFLHCDILIIGAGPSGLSAALSAGLSGAEVILIDEDFQLGGRLLSENYNINNMHCSMWTEKTITELSKIENIRIMNKTTAFACFDHGIYGALEKVDDAKKTTQSKISQILWKIYSKKTILCTGGTERSIAFGNNDRPGIMLASAVRSYVNRWGVSPGNNTVIFTNNDDGWKTAFDLKRKGLVVSAIIDTRNKVDQTAPHDTEVILGEKIVDTKGHHTLKTIHLSNGRKINTDCLAISGGWNPNVHLSCHHGSKPVWREDVAAFVPGKNLPKNMTVAGTANGTLKLNKVIEEGIKLGELNAKMLGHTSAEYPIPKTDYEHSDIIPFWYVKESKNRAWVDLQNDVTTKDIKLAYQEGYTSVEHLKRYTTLGMGTDQGKTSNVLGLAIMSYHSKKSIPETGTTAYRLPYTPISIGAFAGQSRSKHFRPYRLTPSHNWAKKKEAKFVETGAWLRAQWFPQTDEHHWRETVDREVNNTRKSVGICDVTTLGKIDIQGRDAAIFLDKVYANGFQKLPIGKTRYGLMLREDGIAMDDGTTARLSEKHFVMTTTTANAVTVFRHLEFCKQCLWPEYDVHLISITEQYAQFAVAGPNSRLLLSKIVDQQHDISNTSFPYMACKEISVCNGISARLFRISFSGELAYEIAVPARYGDSMIKVLMKAGEEFNAQPYGTEALGVMRIEKGHAAGNELNGQTTAQNLNMGKMISKKNDCIGNVLSERTHLNDENNLILTGFKPVSHSDMLTSGAHFVSKEKKPILDNDEGWMTSVAFSPTLGHYIGLGFIVKGNERIGEVVRAVNLLKNEDVLVELVSPHFVDPEGHKLRV